MRTSDFTPSYVRDIPRPTHLQFVCLICMRFEFVRKISYLHAEFPLFIHFINKKQKRKEECVKSQEKR